MAQSAMDRAANGLIMMGSAAGAFLQTLPQWYVLAARSVEIAAAGIELQSGALDAAARRDLAARMNQIRSEARKEAGDE